MRKASENNMFECKISSDILNVGFSDQVDASYNKCVHNTFEDVAKSYRNAGYQASITLNDNTIPGLSWMSLNLSWHLPDSLCAGRSEENMLETQRKTCEGCSFWELIPESCVNDTAEYLCTLRYDPRPETIRYSKRCKFYTNENFEKIPGIITPRQAVEIVRQGVENNAITTELRHKACGLFAKAINDACADNKFECVMSYTWYTDPGDESMLDAIEFAVVVYRKLGFRMRFNDSSNKNTQCGMIERCVIYHVSWQPEDTGDTK